ncbi:MAG: Crp/Fnr family transcriptional regulator [Oscillospiraceae bacterium]|nr:Crp/Fnr family transcriptional regulator [Oscillospiraceae bacterium]
MKKYMEILSKCRLFESMENENITAMLSCLGAEVKSYAKNQKIFTEGETTSHIGIMLSGTAQIVRVDFYGNRSIVTGIESPQLFGESFACTETRSIPVNVIAEKDCEVMLIDSRKILQPCCNACDFHSRMIFNLMKEIAAKNLLLNQKIEIISKRTTREKLMAYLMIQAKKHGSSFTVPYDRQELADFLEVDRSGLSAEISKLRKENVIECKRNFFRLLEK